jgi:hypothetical protein
MAQGEVPPVSRHTGAAGSLWHSVTGSGARRQRASACEIRLPNARPISGPAPVEVTPSAGHTEIGATVGNRRGGRRLHPRRSTARRCCGDVRDLAAGAATVAPRSQPRRPRWSLIWSLKQESTGLLRPDRLGRRGSMLSLVSTGWDVSGPSGRGCRALLIRRLRVRAPGAPRLKTRAGTRVVPVDPQTLDVLKEHQRRQALESSAWNSVWPDTDLSSLVRTVRWCVRNREPSLSLSPCLRGPHRCEARGDRGRVRRLCGGSCGAAAAQLSRSRGIVAYSSWSCARIG